MHSRKATPRRAHRAFYSLLGVAVLSMGAFTNALAKSPGPLTGLAVASSGAVLLLALTLASRILIHVGRARSGTTSSDGAHAVAHRAG